MLAYQLRLAWKSVRRNWILSALIVGGIGLGIAVAMTFVTAYYVVSGDPIPHKSDRLFYVQLDAWNPDSPYDDDDPNEPPDQLTYRDMTALLASDIPTRHAGMYKVQMTIHPEDEGQRPFRRVVRMCHSDFFSLFDVPFEYGGAWTREADAAPEPVVVLSAELNRKLFGGEDSVGRTVRFEDRDFRVVGVMQHWRPVPKFYDPLNGEFDEAEEVFMPFDFGRVFELYSSGNTSNWKQYDGTEYESFLQSESIWIQFWAQLDTPAQKRQYAAFLEGYIAKQKELGRFGRPSNYLLRDVRQWLTFQEVVGNEANMMLTVALLFLLVCSVNLIGILLGKFLSRAPEIGVRRALGASRGWVFTQHLIECELIGVAGGALGLGLSYFGLRLLERLFDAGPMFRLDLNMFYVAVLLALVSALIAGLYPAWRICRVQPSLYLKTQ